METQEDCETHIQNAKRNLFLAVFFIGLILSGYFAMNPPMPDPYIPPVQNTGYMSVEAYEYFTGEMIPSEEITFNVYRIDLRGRTFEEVDQILGDEQIFIELASWVKVLDQKEQYELNMTYNYLVVTNSTNYAQEIFIPRIGQNILYLPLFNEVDDWSLNFECADDLTQKLTNTTFQNWYGIFSAFKNETEIETYSRFLGIKFEFNTTQIRSNFISLENRDYYSTWSSSYLAVFPEYIFTGDEIEFKFNGIGVDYTILNYTIIVSDY